MRGLSTKKANTRTRTSVRDVCIIGLGYVGYPLAELASTKFDTVGIDVSMSRVEELAPKTTDTLRFATTFAAIEDADVVVICVPTPVHDNFQPDLGPVQQATSAVGKHLKKGTIVILESTVNPGVCDDLVKPILQEVSGLECDKDFFLAHCPERINPGDAKWHVGNIARVVGASSAQGLEKALEFYRSIIDAEIKPMGSLKEAEAVKVVENSFRDINIAFVNELAMSFDQLGIDVVNVIEGAATKPFSFMPHFPGVGVGGHCIPVDPYYLIEYAQGRGFYHDFLRLARRINHEMPVYTAKQTMLTLNQVGASIAGATVTVMGVAYKPDIEDWRESPSLLLISELLKLGANVRIFDPYVKGAVEIVKEHISHAKHPGVSNGSIIEQTFTSIESATHGSDALIVATAHKHHKSIFPERLKEAGIKAVIDGRNCLRHLDFSTYGIAYKGIGR